MHEFYQDRLTTPASEIASNNGRSRFSSRVMASERKSRGAGRQLASPAMGF